MAEKINSRYPSDFEPASVKATKEWAYEYLSAMWEDARNRNSSFSYQDKAAEFIENRKYAEGTQSIEKYKNLIADEGDNTYMNLNWDVSSPMSTIVRYIVGKMINHPYKPQAKAVDQYSKTEADKKKRELEFNLLMKDVAPEFEKATGQNPLAGAEYIPEEQDDIDIYMNTTYKQSRCIATEELVNHFKLKNDWKSIETKLAKDLVCNKIGGVRIFVDKNNGLRARYIDPVNLVTDWVKKDDFSDAKHMGELIDITISELRVIAQGELTEEELIEVAKNVAGRYGNSDFDFGDRRYYNGNYIDQRYYNNFKVRVLDAEVKTTNRLLYQKQENKYGGYFFQQKDENFKPPKNPKRKRELVYKDVEVSYTGLYIVDTKYVINWGLKKFMVRKRLNSSVSTQTPLGFIVNAPDIYEMTNQSLVRSMIPIADNLAILELKMQQFIAEAAPSGHAINIDAANEALAGMGLGKMNPLDARNLRNAIGDIYFKSVSANGMDLLRGQPAVQDLPNGIDQTIERFTALYNARLAQMREIAGVPRGIDGSTPDRDALIGVQKIAMEGSDESLRTLRNAFFDIQKRTFNQAIKVYQYFIEYKVNTDEIVNALGENIISNMDLSELSNSDLDIDIKMLPDTAEKSKLSSYLAIALERQAIDVKDAVIAENLLEEDVDKAEYFLIKAINKFKREQEQRAMRDVQANAEQQKQSALAAAEAEQIKQQAKAQADISVDNNKIQQETAQKIALEEEKRKTVAVEFEYKLKLIERNAELKAKLESSSIPEEAGKVEPSLQVSNPAEQAAS